MSPSISTAGSAPLPFSSEIPPGLSFAPMPGCTREGLETITAVVQGVYDIAGPRMLHPSTEQPPPRLADDWIGAPYKPGTDLLVLGFARAANGDRPRSVTVTVSCGPLRQRARVRTGEPLEAFAAVPRESKRRRELAGTYDARWRRDKAPLLPDDFDERFFQAAQPELTAIPHLRGDERLAAENVSTLGPIDLPLPGLRVEVEILLASGTDCGPARLDTVVLEPEISRLTLVWRRRAPLPDGTGVLRGFRIHAD